MKKPYKILGEDVKESIFKTPERMVCKPATAYFCILYDESDNGRFQSGKPLFF